MAYNVLSDPSSRVAYDANPCATGDIFTNPQSADDTFDGVLQVFFADFMSGDFEVMRMVLREYLFPFTTFILTDDPETMKEVNPAFRMEDETITNVIAGLRKLREVVLGTRTYVRVLRREILHLYDIQYSLRYVYHERKALFLPCIFIDNCHIWRSVLAFVLQSNLQEWHSVFPWQ